MFNYSKISSRREYLGLSQKDLSTLTGLREDALSRLENGRSLNPQLLTLEALARALEVNISYFSTL